MDYDPFEPRRDRPLATSDFETLAHLIKSAIGTGIFSMPLAFKESGLTLGVIAVLITGLITGHCSYLMVKCAHKLCHQTKQSELTLIQTLELAFDNGPGPSSKFTKLARYAAETGIFVAYFGICSVYNLIVAANFQQVLEFYYDNIRLDLRVFVALLLVPDILIVWIPNLKYLAPVSVVANLIMFGALGITFYYICSGLPPTIEDREHFRFLTVPITCSISLFAMTTIGVIMPLENNMRTPEHMIGLFGVIAIGASFITILYAALGFLGYWRYGEKTEDSITLNFPLDEELSQSVKLLVAFAVFLTYALQFYVAVEIIWNNIKHRFPDRPVLAHYVLKTSLAIVTVIVSIAVPLIGPFLGLVGALCFSIFGVIMPALVEILVFWEDGFGPLKWKLWKNIGIIIFGFCALIFGTAMAMKDILSLYM